mgnify:CR=1 FL=1
MAVDIRINEAVLNNLSDTEICHFLRDTADPLLASLRDRLTELGEEHTTLLDSIGRIIESCGGNEEAVYKLKRLPTN